MPISQLLCVFATILFTLPICVFFQQLPMRKRSTLRREAHDQAMASHPILSAPFSSALC
jgi:hypothetical protein